MKRVKKFWHERIKKKNLLALIFFIVIIFLFAYNLYRDYNTRSQYLLESYTLEPGPFWEDDRLVKEPIPSQQITLPRHFVFRWGETRFLTSVTVTPIIMSHENTWVETVLAFENLEEISIGIWQVSENEWTIPRMQVTDVNLLVPADKEGYIAFETNPPSRITLKSDSYVWFEVLEIEDPPTLFEFIRSDYGLWIIGILIAAFITIMLSFVIVSESEMRVRKQLEIILTELRLLRKKLPQKRKKRELRSKRL